MPIIIDTNCFPLFFEDLEYLPLRKWIIDWPWMIVYWGNKFNSELEKNERVLNLLINFSKIWKTIRGNTKLIDDEQSKIELLISDPDFDDPHLIALSKITKTLLIATKDKRSIKFLTRPSLYSSNKLIPKIYSWKRNKSILNKANIHRSNKTKCKILRNCEKPVI